MGGGERKRERERERPRGLSVVAYFIDCVTLATTWCEVVPCCFPPSDKAGGRVLSNGWQLTGFHRKRIRLTLMLSSVERDLLRDCCQTELLSCLLRPPPVSFALLRPTPPPSTGRSIKPRYFWMWPSFVAANCESTMSINVDTAEKMHWNWAHMFHTQSNAAPRGPPVVSHANAPTDPPGPVASGVLAQQWNSWAQHQVHQQQPVTQPFFKRNLADLICLSYHSTWVETRRFHYVSKRLLIENVKCCCWFGPRWSALERDWPSIFNSAQHLFHLRKTIIIIIIVPIGTVISITFHQLNWIECSKIGNVSPARFVSIEFGTW